MPSSTSRSRRRARPLPPCHWQHQAARRVAVLRVVQRVTVPQMTPQLWRWLQQQAAIMQRPLRISNLPHGCRLVREFVMELHNRVQASSRHVNVIARWQNAARSAAVRRDSRPFSR